ncbi:MAG: cytochrome P460 family protein [Acidobacteria bacterium]|nr:cytochrome P460 family protein [Acidobacteriota bacterium]
MILKRRLQLLTIILFAASALAWSANGFNLTASAENQSSAAAQNPCAKKKGQNPCNPCAKKKGMNPCNPCAKKMGQNPCNPCAKKKAMNPCNPCAMKKASSEVYSPATAYSGWKKINKKAFLSEPHSGMFVITYANSTAEAAIKSKQSSFPAGSILVKESHADQNGKPGMKGMIFSMEKTADGWFWVTTDATGHVMEKGNSQQMQMCAQCHQSAKMDSAFLRTK